MPPRRSAFEQPPAGPAPPPLGWGKNVQKKKWFPEGLQWSVTSMVFCVRRHFYKKFGRRTPRSSTLHRLTNPSVTAWIWSTSSHQDRISTPSLCTTEGKLARENFVLAPQDAISTCACDGNVAFCGLFCGLFWCSLTSVLLRERQGGDSERVERGESRETRESRGRPGRAAKRLRIQERTELRSRDRDQSPRSCGTARAWLVAVRLDDSPHFGSVC